MKQLAQTKMRNCVVQKSQRQTSVCVKLYSIGLKITNLGSVFSEREPTFTFSIYMLSPAEADSACSAEQGPPQKGAPQEDMCPK